MKMTGKVKSLVRGVVGLMSLGVGLKQWAASVSICALLMPVFWIPAQASVGTNYIPAEDYSQFEPVNPPLPIWEQAGNNLDLIADRWLMKVDKPIIYAVGDKTPANDDKNAGSSKTESSEGKTNTKSKSENKETVKVKNSEKLSVTTKVNAAPTASMAVMVNQPLPDDEFDSKFSYENNLGAPTGQVEMDSANRAAAIPVRHRAGIANFSFGLPLASLPGRGIDAGVGLTYNSRAWNKSFDYDTATQTIVPHLTYDVEQSWIAPGFSSGFGYLETGVTATY